MEESYLPWLWTLQIYFQELNAEDIKVFYQQIISHG